MDEDIYNIVKRFVFNQKYKRFYLKNFLNLHD